MKKESMFFLPSNLWIMANDGEKNQKSSMDFVQTVMELRILTRANSNYVKMTYFFKELTWNSLHTTN